MKRPTHQSFKKAAFKIAGVKENYKALQEEFVLIAELIRAHKIEEKSQKRIHCKDCIDF